MDRLYSLASSLAKSSDWLKPRSLSLVLCKGTGIIKSQLLTDKPDILLEVMLLSIILTRGFAREVLPLYLNLCIASSNAPSYTPILLALENGIFFFIHFPHKRSSPC